MKKLILAEKPSVARNIGDALGKVTKHEGYIENEGYVITWAFGHLLSLYDVKDYDSSKSSWQMENYPFIPRIFEYKVKPSTNDRTKADLRAQKQLNIIKKLMKRSDISDIISACDYDREGQIIGDIIFKVLKPMQKIYRLLLNEWTPSAVINGLNTLKSNEQMIPLRDAGISRQWADWVMGINLTAVTTLKFVKNANTVLNIGRVILPTLKIIYDRDHQIKHFSSESYYKLSSLFLKDSAVFEGIYFKNKKDKFKSKNTLDLILENLDWPNQKGSLSGEVIKKDFNRKKEYAPYLFNLSNLQGYITSKYRGWTSSKVLKVAQSLYEKKLITYPRTSSLALEESLVDRTRKVLALHKKGLPYEDLVEFKVTKRIFDNNKVESHSAIMPTYLLPKKLSDDEIIVYHAIKNRFMIQFMPVAEFDETKLVITIKDYLFHSSGRVQIVKGWKVVDPGKSTDRILPTVELGDMLPIRAINLTTHETEPPKRHTEKTLLKVMETCGKSYKGDQSDEMIASVLSGFSIGTAATRADIITKLERIGYIKREKKSLLTTELGCQLVETFPVHDLFDLEYTGRLEKQLSDISKGKMSKNEFLHSIFKFTDESISTIKNFQDVAFTEKVKPKEHLGICPNCGGYIIETTKSFGCDQWKAGCKFVIWKNDKFFSSLKKKPNKTIVKALLKNGKAEVKGFIGKSGKTFNAYVRYEKKEDSEYYHWKLEFQ